MDGDKLYIGALRITYNSYSDGSLLYISIV